MNTAFGRTFRSLRGFNYRVWIVGAFVSNVGTWVQRTAQDWLVLTQLTHHDASAVGLVMAFQFAPQLLLLPWTGFAADYFNQRKLLVTTQATMGTLALALALLTITGTVQLWHVYIFAFLFGSAAAFDAARMIGPAVSGLVIAAIGTGWAFLINGASFIAVLISLAFLRVAELHPNARAHRASRGLTAGFRYVWRRPDLMTILLMLFLIGTFGLNFPIFISTMAVSVFHADARGYGLLSSIMAIGTVTGALLCARRGRSQFSVMLVGAAVFGFGCTLAAIAPNYWFFACALVITGAAALTFTNTTNSLMQLSTEPAMRGRVMALRTAIALGGTPIGAPIVGWIANNYGPRWALGVGATAGFVAALVAVFALARPRPRPAARKPSVPKPGKIDSPAALHDLRSQSGPVQSIPPSPM